MLPDGLSCICVCVCVCVSVFVCVFVFRMRMRMRTSPSPATLSFLPGVDRLKSGEFRRRPWDDGTGTVQVNSGEVVSCGTTLEEGREGDQQRQRRRRRRRRRRTIVSKENKNKNILFFFLTEKEENFELKIQQLFSSWDTTTTES